MRPHQVVDDKEVRPRGMAPSAITILPQLPAIFGVEGVERPRVGVVGVNGDRLGLGQQQHPVTIDHHAKQKLEGLGKAHFALGALGDGRAVDLPEGLA